MKTIILAELALLVAASACGSARATTPTDTGSAFAYSSRQQVKCYTETMKAGETEVHASCAGLEDLPLAGSCSNQGFILGGPDAILAASGPAGWESASGIPPRWFCYWAVGGQPVNLPQGQATICCVVKSQ